MDLWDTLGNPHRVGVLRVLPCFPVGGNLTQSMVVLAGLENTLLVWGVDTEHTLGKDTGFELWDTVYRVAEQDTGLDKIAVFLW